MSVLTDFLLQSWFSLLETIRGLIVPAIFFILLGMLLKGRGFFDDIRRVMPETKLNVQFLLLNLFFTMPLLVFGATFLTTLWQSTGLVVAETAAWADLHPILVIFIAVTIGDFVGYWRHRFEHSSFLWPSHAVHHSDTEMTWLSLERFHPINRITTFTIDASALLILGLPPYAVIANGLVRHYYGFFIHADLPWTYGPLNKLFVSPAMHRWHHSADEIAHDTNFATVYGLWDWAFGTHYVPGPCDSPLGVSDNMEQTFSSQLLYAMRPSTYARMWRKKRSVEPAE